ncbi:hypothetical protein AB0I89_22345, partial [Micromonospora sp. NPDC049801]
MEIPLEDDRVTRLTKTGLPFVTIGRIAEPHDMSWIDIDYSGLIARCVRHLADLGHRHVALVNRSAELVAAGYGPSHRALTGFRAAADRGLTGVEVCCGDDTASGEACVEQLLVTHPDVTAIATINEAALPGLQRALTGAGTDGGGGGGGCGVGRPPRGWGGGCAEGGGARRGRGDSH